MITTVLAQLHAYYDRDPSIWSTASGDAHRVASLGLWMTIIGTAVLVAVLGILARALWSRRHVVDDGMPVPLVSEQRWVLGGGLVMPAIVLGAVFVLTLSTLHAYESPATTATDVTVIGHQWWWEIRYPNDTVVTANELHIPVGQPVRVVLRSNDVIHSLWIPNLQGKTDLIPGQENQLVLRADSAGVYRAECAEFCGMQHAHMSLSVVADPPSVYTRWLGSARAPAAASADDPAGAGLAAFMDHSCAFCHSIRGTAAGGAGGPDLTHVGGRLTLAGGTLPNTAGNLAGWITNPDRLKPGAKMPPVAMDGASLQAIVHYLEGLK